MKPATISRAVASAASAALLASLALATVAGPALAATKDTCVGKKATILGTDAADVIVGTRGRDVIVAGGGDDIIRGRGSGDIICAGSGDDTVVGNRGADKLFGGPGSDILNGRMGNDICAPGNGDGVERRCEVIARKATVPEPTPSFQTTCEGAGGTFHVTYPGTSNTPVCEFSPPIGTPEPWNTMFDTLSATCPPGGSGFSGDPSGNPSWMGCLPAR